MSAPQPLQPGTIIGGDYRIVGPLASGGMGALYIAEQLSIGKQRALKVMHPSLVKDPSLRDRFVQEARVGAMVPSDHVVEVLGAGVDPTLGVPWLAMELLNGEDLAKHVARRGPLAPSELPPIVRPLCHALGAAHSRGIVHRDVKPENVFLATTMSSTQPMVVKVLDFGIAKVAAQARGESTAAMGTPMWMAPEQTELRSRVSPATDVWPLGLIAFWLLTGLPYWRAAQEGIAASVPQLMREILFEPLDPPSVRARELGSPAELPPAFDAWFLHCVERDPSGRFPNATEAGNALFSQVLGAGTAISIAPPADPSAPSWPSQPAPPPSQAATLAAASAVVPAPVAKRSGGLGAVLLLGAVFFGLLVLAGLAGAFYYLTPEDEVASVSSALPSGASAEPTEIPSEPEPAPSASASAAPSASAPPASNASPKPTSHAGAKPSVAAKSSKGPYSPKAAAAVVKARARAAGLGCQHLKGPAALAGTAIFVPSGGIKNIVMDPKDSISARGSCARAHIYAAHINPYDGKETHSVPFAVTF